MESWIDHPNITDVIFAGLPGQESGNGLLDVLTGNVVPSGRLPFSKCLALLADVGCLMLMWLCVFGV